MNKIYSIVAFYTKGAGGGLFFFSSVVEGKNIQDENEAIAEIKTKVYKEVLNICPNAMNFEANVKEMPEESIETIGQFWLRRKGGK